MKRTEAREEAFKLLYSLQLMEEKDLEEQIELYVKDTEIKDKAAIAYISNIINGTSQENEKIESIISENIKQDWNINRISTRLVFTPSISLV